MTTPTLVFVTQLVDADDPVLGFSVLLVRALQERVDRLVVVANEVRRVPDDFGCEVRSLGKERGYGRARKVARYQAILADVCRPARGRRGGGQPLTLLAHMCPSYLSVAAPVVRAAGGRTMLWYTHPRGNPGLRLAEWAAGAVLTALPGSYPCDSPKARAIGHSIDVDRFAFQPVPPRDGPMRLIALGRTAPTKQYPVVIRAVAEARAAGVDAHLRIVGPSTNDGERRHRREVTDLIRRMGVGDVVTLDDEVVPADIPAALAGAHALVNAHAAGSADKVVFEAMACGRPPLVSSPAFAPLVNGAGMRLSFRDGDVADLAGRITALAEAPGDDLGRIGTALRDTVVREHSLAHWADTVVAIAGELHHR